MKRLHTLLIRSFIPPFLITFSVCLFLLVMQFLWKYADDLMGKGLPPNVIAELMFYATANLVPMALPLAILLSSIMAFGGLGENNELTCMKTSGISLVRIMLPIGAIVFIISLGAFYFSNYTWAEANLKLRVLISDITHKKPALAIKEGVFFNDIEGFSIRIQKKHSNSDFEDVLIIAQNPDGSSANRREIKAKKAKMMPDETGEFLVVNLYDGIIDETLDRQSFKDSKHPYQQTYFDHTFMRIRLHNFQLQRTELSLFQEMYELLSAKQLMAMIDTFDMKLDELNLTRSVQLSRMYYIFRDTLITPLHEIATGELVAPSNDDLNKIPHIATSSVRRKKELIMSETDKMTEQIYVENKRNHLMAFHRKFTLSYACMLLFFIGAPLGAIIRKGGFGIPVVFSVILFITYYMVNVTGEKMAKTDVLEPFTGMWLAELSLTPVAIFLTMQAMNDAALLDMDTYKRIFRYLAKLFRLKRSR